METDLEYVGAVAEKMYGGWFARSLLSIGITIPATIIGLDPYLILGLFVMVALDMITGIVSAKINGDELSSRRLSRTVLKMILYFCFLIGSFIVTSAYPDFNELHVFALSFLILIEFKSILENLVKAGIILPPGISNWITKALNLKK